MGLILGNSGTILENYLLKELPHDGFENKGGFLLAYLTKVS